MMQTHGQTVFPARRYDDAWAAIAFLESCFGFERQAVRKDPNGKVAHGELRLGTASYDLSSTNGTVTSDNPWTSVTMQLSMPLIALALGFSGRRCTTASRSRHSAIGGRRHTRPGRVGSERVRHGDKHDCVATRRPLA